MNINILGTLYTVHINSKDERLKLCDGFCDTSSKQIHVTKFDKAPDSISNLKYYTSKVLRHEILHAFIYESGLSVNSLKVEDWATNEEMIDWFAIQFPKIAKVYKEVGCG